jgi:hypothetical protein
MTLDLTDEETEALLKQLNNMIDGDKYQFSARSHAEGDPREDQA